MEYITAAGGISEGNRPRLAALYRAFDAPFTAEDAARVLGVGIGRAQRFLAYLAARGWLARVSRGKYVKVPLETAAPSQWREDPWIVATVEFSRCYIGGWSAAEHWGLTDQLFREVVVYSTRQRRDHHPVIQETPFWVKVIPERMLFGTRAVWRRQTRVEVSDPSRTVADVLDDPSVGGGIRHVSEVVAEYFGSDMREDALLLDYIGRLENRTVYKRLGYMVERLGVDAPRVARECVERQSAGTSLLDPGLGRRGPILRRWNLRVNTSLPQAASVDD